MVKACVTWQGCEASDGIVSRIWAYRMVLPHSGWVFLPQLAGLRSSHKRGWFPRWGKILPSWHQHCPEWKTLFDRMCAKWNNTSSPFLFYSTLAFKFHKIPSHLTSMLPLLWVLSWKEVLMEDQICVLSCPVHCPVELCVVWGTPTVGAGVSVLRTFGPISLGVATLVWGQRVALRSHAKPLFMFKERDQQGKGSARFPFFICRAEAGASSSGERALPGRLWNSSCHGDYRSHLRRVCWCGAKHLSWTVAHPLGADTGHSSVARVCDWNHLVASSTLYCATQESFGVWINIGAGN